MLEDLIENEEYLPLTYVLSLVDDKWYVGFSTRLNKRLAQHIKGKGANWTKVYPMTGLVDVRVGNVEKELTLEYMQMYGWENVRGSSWCAVDLKKPPVPLRQLRPVKVL